MAIVFITMTNKKAILDCLYLIINWILARLESWYKSYNSYKNYNDHNGYNNHYDYNNSNSFDN